MRNSDMYIKCEDMNDIDGIMITGDMTEEELKAATAKLFAQSIDPTYHERKLDRFRSLFFAMYTNPNEAEELICNILIPTFDLDVNEGCKMWEEVLTHYRGKRNAYFAAEITIELMKELDVEYLLQAFQESSRLRELVFGWDYGTLSYHCECLIKDLFEYGNNSLAEELTQIYIRRRGTNTIAQDKLYSLLQKVIIWDYEYEIELEGWEIIRKLVSKVRDKKERSILEVAFLYAIDKNEETAPLVAELLGDNSKLGFLEERFNLLCESSYLFEEVAKYILSQAVELEMETGCDMIADLIEHHLDIYDPSNTPDYAESLMSCINHDTVTQIFCENDSIKEYIFVRNPHEPGHFTLEYLVHLIASKDFQHADEILCLFKNNKSRLRRAMEYILNSSMVRSLVDEDGISFLADWISCVSAVKVKQTLEETLNYWIECVNGKASKGNISYELLIAEQGR